MANVEIDLVNIKLAVDTVLNHVLEDLEIRKVSIDPKEDFYWECPAPQVYDSSMAPQQVDSGRLTDDVQFIEMIRRGQGADVSYNLVHLAPLLRYIGEKVKR